MRSKIAAKKVIWSLFSAASLCSLNLCMLLAAVCCKRSTMLLSTRIFIWLAAKTTLVRDWRVVNIESEESRSIDVGTLFSRILDHVYDPLEPFIPTPADKSASFAAAIGGSQQGDFQDLPLSVCVADAIQFGVYLKFFIIREDPGVAVVCSSIRNAAEVSSFV